MQQHCLQNIHHRYSLQSYLLATATFPLARSVNAVGFELPPEQLQHTCRSPLRVVCNIMDRPEYTWEDMRVLVARENKRREQVREACKRWREKNIENGSYTEKKKEYRERYIKKKLEKA